MPTWLLHNALFATPLALGVILLGRCIRLRPALGHALWLIVLLRLVMPPLVSWPWRVPVALPTQEVVAPQTGAAPEPVVRSDLVSEEETFTLVLKEGESAASPTAPTESAPPTDPVPSLAPPQPTLRPTAVTVNWWPVVTLAWLVGAVWVAGWHWRQARQLARLVAAARPAPVRLRRRVKEVAALLGVRPPMVRVGPAGASPVVAGLGRPVLLWPKGLEEKLPPAGCAAVLAHELAHLKRRDHWVRWLESLAAVLHWWDPLLRLVRHRLRAEAELACDSLALATFPAARRAFAEALLAVCEQDPTAARPAPALGVGGEVRDFQRRLTMIMLNRAPGRLSRLARLGVGAVAILALPAWTFGQQSSSAQPPAQVEQRRIEVQIVPSQSGQHARAVGVVRLVEEPTTGRDQKIAELERKLQALRAEIAALRAQQGRGQPSQAPARATQRGELRLELAPRASQPLKLDVRPVETQRGVFTIQPTPARVQASGNLGVWVAKPEGQPRVARIMVGDRIEVGEQTMTLSRTTYHLPAGKAQALAAFLRENVKTGVLETTVEGDKLIVTTTPEAQRVIGQFVALVAGKQSVQYRLKVQPAGQLQYWAVPAKPAGAAKPATVRPVKPAPAATAPAPKPGTTQVEVYVVEKDGRVIKRTVTTTPDGQTTTDEVIRDGKSKKEAPKPSPKK